MTYGQPTEETATPNGLWPEGNYTGKYIAHQCAASVTKGTPGIAIGFEVDNRNVTVECWITEATLGGMTGDQLAALNWNGEYGDGCKFDPPETVPLYMKYDTYKEKVRERWNISVQGKADPAALAGTARACQLWKARRAAPAPTPAGKPSVPPKAAPKPPAKPAPKAPAKPAPKEDTRDATTQDEAWAIWVAAKCDDAVAFWNAAEAVAGKDTAPEDITPAQWGDIARHAPPF